MERSILLNAMRAVLEAHQSILPLLPLVLSRRPCREAASSALPEGLDEGGTAVREVRRCEEAMTHYERKKWKRHERIRGGNYFRKWAKDNGKPSAFVHLKIMEHDKERRERQPGGSHDT